MKGSLPSIMLRKVNQMKQIIKKLMIISLFIVCTVTATTASAYPAQGTEGDELQVAEAQHLEIQLGTEWTLSLIPI